MKILLTHDGSVLADNAVPRVRALGTALGSDVAVVALCITPPHAGAGSSEAVEAGRSLDRIQRALGAEGMHDVTPMVQSGEVGPLIVETAARLGCDLIAMSTSGHSGPKQFLGSVADYVVRHSHNIPVMLCRPEPAGLDEFKKILLPLDGSAANANAIQQTLQLATLTGAAVVLVRLVDTPEQIRALTTPAGYELDDALIADDAVEQIIAAEAEDARRELDADATRLRAAGVADVAVVISPGTPGETIVSTAAQLGCDVIVMSPHGRGRGAGIRVLGSVADHVLEHVAHGAIVVVPPSDGTA